MASLEMNTVAAAAPDPPRASRPERAVTDSSRARRRAPIIPRAGDVRRCREVARTSPAKTRPRPLPVLVPAAAALPPPPRPTHRERLAPIAPSPVSSPRTRPDALGPEYRSDGGWGGGGGGRERPRPIPPAAPPTPPPDAPTPTASRRTYSSVILTRRLRYGRAAGRGLRRGMRGGPSERGRALGRITATQLHRRARVRVACVLVGLSREEQANIASPAPPLGSLPRSTTEGSTSSRTSPCRRACYRNDGRDVGFAIVATAETPEHGLEGAGHL